MKTCLLHARTFARLGARLKGLSQPVEFYTIGDDGQCLQVSTGAPAELPALDIVFGNTDAFYSPAVQTFMRSVLTAPSVDWFQSVAAGIEHPALVMIGRKAARYTTNHRQAEAMAEWAIWQALDFLRAGPVHRAQAADGKWARVPARELSGSRWLVIGYGAIGEAVGWRATALGAEVAGIRRTPGPATGAPRVASPSSLMEELPLADIVVLAMPHTAETENFADAAFFAAMRPDSLFMNLGRGALVDEGALVGALDAGRPAFAALDVVRDEPLPPESPLWRHPKIAITPHDSSDTPQTSLRADETFLANLERYLAGVPLAHEVPREAFA